MDVIYGNPSNSVIAFSDDLSTPSFPHLSYDFLQEGKIRDINGNRHGELEVYLEYYQNFLVTHKPNLILAT